MTIKTFAVALMATTLLAAPGLAEDTMQKQATPPAATNAQPAPATHSAQTAQQSDQWRASKLVGLNVYNGNNEKVGDINELITGKDGQVDLVVIGAGGFLGMGEHNVAVKWNEIKFVNEPVRTSSTTSSTTTPTTGSGATTSTAPVNAANTVRDYPDHAVINMTKDQLKVLPAFQYASQTKSR
jgi:sporulation protein YlmC with PRC-barrel domain